MRYCMFKVKDNTKETQKDIKAVRTERLKPFRFTSTNQPAKRGRKKGRSATDWLKKLSHTKVSFLNPLTGKDELGEINLVVAIQLILKATQDSDLASIKEYFDRLDGKVPQELKGEGFNGPTTIIIERYKKPEEENAPSDSRDRIPARS